MALLPRQGIRNIKGDVFPRVRRHHEQLTGSIAPFNVLRISAGIGGQTDSPHCAASLAWSGNSVPEMRSGTMDECGMDVAFSIIDSLLVTPAFNPSHYLSRILASSLAPPFTHSVPGHQTPPPLDHDTSTYSFPRLRSSESVGAPDSPRKKKKTRSR